MEILDFTGIEGDVSEGSPMSVSLYPSPFTGALTVEICSPESTSGSIAVYDLSGRQVESMSTDSRVEGVHLWEPGDNLPAGSYIIQVRSGEYTITERCLYIP